MAKRIGLSMHTIRFYEKSGLIKGSRDEGKHSNNYFHYDEAVVERLLLIRDAKAVGFTLSEIAGLIDAWYNEEMSTTEKIGVLNRKLEAPEERIQQFREMKKLIVQFKKSIASKSC
ncbi:MAG: MerR family transcriptional regulator [Bacteroidota bacterium]